MLAVLGMASQYAAAAENYIPGALDALPSLPLYLNDPDMYYPDASDGLCWASANADIFAYWDRNAYNGVKYWNLVDNGTAPLREPSLPVAPGHDQADVKSVIEWLAHQYYGLGRGDEAAMLAEFANDNNGLSFTVNYHGPSSTTSGKTTLLNTIKGEIDAGRPLSVGSWGTYFGGSHQIPVMGYKTMANTVDSTIYIHRNTGGTQSEYVNFFSSTWGNLDMDTIVPGGTPVDHYEDIGDNTSATAVTIEPDHIYEFRQTHNFSYSGDADWIKLNAVADREYTIVTKNLGALCDTVLQLYASNGTTMLTQDDDSGDETGASLIIWDCSATDTVYIRVTEKFSRSGHAANYDIQVAHDGSGNPEVVDLQNGVAVANIAGAEDSTDKQYKITVPAGATSLQIAISGGSGDCDLYVKHGAPATTSAYDYRPYLFGNNETVTVSNPTAGDWYIMLHGYNAYSGVTLLASYIVPNYTITTEPIPSAGGVTGGGGSYTSGSQCTVTATANSGYSFANWSEGATVVSTSASYTFTVTGNRTLTANFSANQYTVTFDAQGGTVDPATKTVTYGSAYGDLPTPTRTWHSFGGWWTGAGGTGAQVTTATAVTAVSNHTLYAAWVYLGMNLVLPVNGGILESFTSEYNTTTYMAANLTDGSASAIWRSKIIPGQQTFEYSFAEGLSATLNAVTLVNVSGTYASKGFEIWVLPVGGQWQKALEGELAKSVQPQSFLFADNPLAERVRLVVTSGYNSIYRDLGEFELYGEIVTPPLECVVTRSGANPTNAETLGFAVNFTRAVNGFGQGDITLRTTGTAVGTVGNFTGGGAAYTFDVTGVSGDGEIAASVAAAVCEDAESTPNEASGEAVYVVDNTAPEAGAASSPALQDGGAVEVTFTGVSDNGSGLRQVELWYSLDGGAWQDSGLRSESGDGGFTFQPSAAGSYAFGLVAEDNAGNRSAVPAGQGDTLTDYTVPVDPVNLALPANGGTLESFTSQYSTTTYKAANLTDGSASAIWRSKIIPGQQTFEYSFAEGLSATLNAVTLVNVSGTYASKGFEIWIMPSGGQWQKVTEGNLVKTTEAQEFDLGGVVAERARLVIVSGYSSIYWELAEFELYGLLNAPQRPADQWYAEHGFEPAPGETWEDLDNRVAPGKDTTLWQEYVADTDPNDPASVFKATGIDHGPPVSVGFEPSSTQRVYRLRYTEDLASGVWHDVGEAPRPGEGEGDAISDSQNPAGRRFYRVQVDLPE